MKEIRMEDLSQSDGMIAVNMADLHEKEDAYHCASAEGKIYVGDEVFFALETHPAKMGEVLGAAQVAGIMAAKNTGGLLPMCHTSLLTNCKLTFRMSEKDYAVLANCSVSCVGKKSVEMEALTGVSVALLTIFDMCKSAAHLMRIGEVRLVEDKGGQD